MSTHEGTKTLASRGKTWPAFVNQFHINLWPSFVAGLLFNQEWVTLSEWWGWPIQSNDSNCPFPVWGFLFQPSKSGWPQTIYKVMRPWIARGVYVEKWQPQVLFWSVEMKGWICWYMYVVMINQRAGESWGQQFLFPFWLVSSTKLWGINGLGPCQPPHGPTNRVFHKVQFAVNRILIRWDSYDFFMVRITRF